MQKRTCLAEATSYREKIKPIVYFQLHLSEGISKSVSHFTTCNFFFKFHSNLFQVALKDLFIAVNSQLLF